MTAEIAILNINAVAMAADSAVTLQLPGGQKIYNTVKKKIVYALEVPASWRDGVWFSGFHDDPMGNDH